MNGKVISCEAPSLLSSDYHHNDNPTESHWHYLQFDDNPSKEQLGKAGIRIESLQYVQPGFYRTYLTNQQLSALFQNYPSAKSHLITADEKLGNIQAHEQLVIETDPTFNPNSIPFLNNHLQQITERLYITAGLKTPISSEIINQLANCDHIVFISSSSPLRTLNRYTSGATQGGLVSAVVHDDCFDVPRVIEKRGIDGSNHVLTMLDTGISTNHSLFYDPNNDIKYDVLNEQHRKIIFYSTISGDRNDDVINGHGTHVVGSAVGNAYCTESGPGACLESLYNGVAPKAKIAFIDLNAHSGSKKQDEVDQIAPHSLSMEKEIMRMAHSKISSNSWGISWNKDSEVMAWQLLFSYDYFSYLDPSTSFIFACGNSMSFERMITAPSDGKNVLAVGSVFTPYAPNYETFAIQNFGIRSNWTLSSIKDLVVKRLPFGPDPIRQAIPSIAYTSIYIHENKPVESNNPVESHKISEKPRVLGKKENKFDDSPDLNGKVFVFMNDTLDFAVEVQQIFEVKSLKNASAILMRSNCWCEGVFTQELVAKFNEIGVPCFFIPDYFKIENLGADILAASGAIEPEKHADPFSQSSITSSYGPAHNGLMKPEIVAPGLFVISADSSDQTPKYAGLKTAWGSSSAASSASAAALLLEQYFQDGHFKNNKVTTNSNIIRAALVNSASKMPNPKSTPTNEPDCIQGHGAINLANVMEFNDSSFHLMVGEGALSVENYFAKFKVDLPTSSENSKKGFENSEDSKKGFENSENAEQKLLGAGRSGNEIRIAMAYLDQPTAAESSSPLSIDYNMYVVSPSGKVYFGNNYPDKRQEHFSTVEKIVIPSSEVENGEYTIHIAAVSFNSLLYSVRSDFAVVATIPHLKNKEEEVDFLDFKRMYGQNPLTAEWEGYGLDGKETTTQWNDLKCNGRGESIGNNVTGTCDCKDNYIGIDCQLQYTRVTGQTTTVTVPRNGMGYFLVRPSLSLRYLKVESEAKGNYELFYGGAAIESPVGDQKVSDLDETAFFAFADIIPHDYVIKIHSLRNTDAEFKLTLVSSTPSSETTIASSVASSASSSSENSDEEGGNGKNTGVNTWLTVATIVGFAMSGLLIAVIVIMVWKAKHVSVLNDPNVPGAIGAEADTVSPDHLIA